MLSERDKRDFEAPILPERADRFAVGEALIIEADTVIPHGSDAERVAPPSEAEADDDE